MHLVDYLIPAVYLAVLFGWAIYIGRGSDSEDFFVFGRRAPLLLVLFSVVSTWVGVGTTVATAASGYETGISLGLTAAVGGVFGAIGAAWFAPRLKQFGDKFRAHTIGDFFRVRYGSTAQRSSGAVVLAVYILLTAGQLVGLSSLIQVWTGAAFFSVVCIAAVTTIVYTAFAGIKSDFYTDVVHFVVMAIVFAAVLVPVALTASGGFQGIASLPASYFDPFAYGGVPFFVAGVLFGTGSVFITMELWQRVYASKSGREAQIAVGLSILIIILFYVASAFIGLSARVLIPDLADSNLALFSLMVELLPVGVLGLGLAAVIAVFLSTLNSTLMVASAVIAKDLALGQVDGVRFLRKGRLAVAVVGGIGLVIAVLLPDVITLSVNGMLMLLILLPATFGGFFWSRSTSKAAVWSIIVGLVVTLIALPLSTDIAFLPGFVSSCVVFVTVTLFTEHSQTENNRLA